MLDLKCVLHLRLIIFLMGGNIFVDSDVLLVTDFMNIKIKLVQSFRGTHRGSVCVIIVVSGHTCMGICVYIVFFKKEKEITG
jgi:hypothetical protein